MMRINKISAIACVAVLLFTACGEKQGKTDEKNMDHDAMHENQEGADKMPEVPSGAKVYFGNLDNGQTVTSPVHIEFEVSGMEVEKAGELHENKGHHHLIIDGGPLARGTMVPANAVNIHYGQGQKETEIDLPKGEHTLTLQFADGYHRSYGEQMSAIIKVTVE